MIERLEGWKEIANHFGRNVRTVQRWHRDRGMPVHRVPGGRLGSVYALVPELDEWLRSPLSADRDSDEEPVDDAAEPQPEAGPIARNDPDAAPRPWPLVVAAFVLGAVLAGGAAWRVWAPGATGATCAVVVEPAAIDIPGSGGEQRVSVGGGPGCKWRSFVPVPWIRLDTETGTTPATVTLALPGNHTTSERVATLLVGGQPVRVVQAANPTGCTSAPGPGYVKDGYRYRITSRAVWATAGLLAVARAEGGPKAEGFGWDDLVLLLETRPEEGERFARQVGLYQHSWESTQFTGPCFNYWLIKNAGEPEFVTYHRGMKGEDFKSYRSINGNQFDLGRWNQPNQVLYRVPEPGA
jgi:hypothetical protein